MGMQNLVELLANLLQGLIIAEFQYAIRIWFCQTTEVIWEMKTYSIEATQLSDCQMMQNNWLFVLVEK